MSSKRYLFDKWRDGVTTPTRDINVVGDLNLEADYKEVSTFATVIFSGKVSNQAASGQVVITVTPPSGVQETLTTQTAADGSYQTQKQYGAGSYKAKAHIDQDAQYVAADSAEVAFTVGLQTRTITLEVNLA